MNTNGLKSSAAESFSDSKTLPLKRRKTDVEALEAEIGVLMKQEEESARLLEVARQAQENCEVSIVSTYRVCYVNKS